jgi:uncharacterized protein YybS (DUF2232 family)
MPPTAAILIGAIFSLVGLFLTNILYRRAPFWLPILVAVSLGLIIACAPIFWWGG